MADFQQQVYIDGAFGRVGTISRNMISTPKIPLVAQGTAVRAGGFGWRGTDPEKQVIGVNAGATSVDGLVIFSRMQANLRGAGANNLNTLFINEGEECDLIKSGFAYVLSTTASVFGQSVYVNPTTGEIQTATTTPAGFIDSGWKVETGAAANQVCEISK